MARTKGTRRLPPHEDYAAHARSAAQVAAGVPPTARQYKDAFDYKDEIAILDYLGLAPTIELDMAATNAFILSHRRSPPARRQHNSNSNDGDSHDPYLWFWPYRWCRLIRPISLFTFVARHAFAEVVAWLFCDRERVERIGATLTLVFSNTLRAAITGCHLHIVEMLLQSPVFLELMTDETRQLVLDAALRYAGEKSVSMLLVAHGASADSVDDLHTPWEWFVFFQVFMAGPVVGPMRRAVGCNALRALECCLHEAVVADHSVLIAAVEIANPEAVEILIERGFADLDARTSDGQTALMVCAAMDDVHCHNERRERRRDVFGCLLNAGADTTLCDSQGRTALHVAIASSNLACVELLLDHMIESSGMMAVHSDLTALTMAFRLRDAHGVHSQRVLTALLERGACSNVYKELVMPSRTSVDCNDPHRCIRDRKRKRGDEEEAGEV